METMIKNWYVVYTKAGCERRVMNVLERQNIPSLNLPHNKINYADKDFESISPFERMIFVNASEEEVLLIKRIRGVLGFMFRMHKVAIIDAADIAAIQYFLAESETINLEKIKFRVNDFELSDKIRSSSGNDYGTISLNSVKKIYLHSLGYAILTDVQIDQRKREEVGGKLFKSVA
jgi:transcription antitermination factor NusG